MSQNNDNSNPKTVIGGEKEVETVLSELNIESNSTLINSENKPKTFESNDELIEKVKIPKTSIIEADFLKPIESPNPTYSNDSLIKDEETLKMLRSLNFWAKFHVILGFISAGTLIMAGIVYIFFIITIPVTIIYWIVAGISIWLLTYLYRAFNKFNELSTVKTQEEFNNNVLQGLDLMKMYYKITGIFSIVSVVVLAVIFIGAIFFLIIFSSTAEFQDFIKNPKYSANSRPATSFPA